LVFKGLNGCMNKVNLAAEWVNYGDKQNLTLLHTTNCTTQ